MSSLKKLAGKVGSFVGETAGSVLSFGGDKAAERAANAQADAARQAGDVQERMFERAIELGEPSRQLGQSASASLESLILGTPLSGTAGYQANLQDYFNQQGNEQDVDFANLTDEQLTLQEAYNRMKGLNPNQDRLANFYKDPGYQFRLDEGMKALQRAAAAKGQSFSGAEAKALQRFGQNTASSEYNNYINRLQGLAGMGQSALQNQQGLTTQQGQSLADMFQNVGAARASGYIGANNARQQGIGNALEIGKMFAGSDKNLKDNIVKVGVSERGFNIYEFNYKKKPDIRYRGVMAQEVQEVLPDAVHTNKDGNLMVDYSKIDVRMEVVR